MHDRCEKFVKGEISEERLVYGDKTKRYGWKGPAVIAEKYVPVLTALRDHPNGDRHTELRLGFDNEWYLCGGISPKAWVIGVLDASAGKNGSVDIYEWKSGSPKTTHADQRKLYALFGLRRWLVDEVRVTTFYLEDTSEPERLVVKATAEDKLKKLWQDRVDQMKNDDILAPAPGDHCNYCDYAKSKKGPCAFG